MIETKTIHTVEFGDSLVVIRNVPCSACDYCGETVFDDVVTEKIEEILDNYKIIGPEFALIDYSRIA